MQNTNVVFTCLTPPQLSDDFPDILAAALAQDQGHIIALQLRLKKNDGSCENDDLIKQWARRLMPLVKAHECRLHHQ